ncbi:TIR domain-containing protein [Nocardia sp. NPDC050435]|uniref:TIR domain-containing protein n=1 Tax=Nocardia sp. NPDC050435 TaxID=3155040 RepID=UPI0033EF948D
MAKRVFVSFDYDYDRFLKEALISQARKTDSPFAVHDWSIKEPSWDWKMKARRRIRACDIVIVMCGEHTHVASGVSTELEITRDESIGYFLLKGYDRKECTKPAAARVSDNMYDWTWPNLKLLIGGAR